MRLTLLAATALAGILITQQACAKEPAREPTEAPAAAQTEVSRIPERDDSRPQAFINTVTTQGDCSRDPRAALDGAIAATLNAVRTNDAMAFLDLIGSDGLDLSGTVSRDGLERQFSGQTGRYCDLFQCGGRVGDLRGKFHSGPTDIQYDAKNKRAAVFINANTNDELDLSYKWSATCRWELTAIAVP